MYVVSVTVHVKPEHVADFIVATEKNARGSWQEPGCHRFDVAQCIESPSRFLLYEVYDDEDAFKAHQTTSHYKSWRETVADWMAQPREGVKHTSVSYTHLRAHET